MAIGIFVKEPGKTGSAQVHHAELRGKRQDKYDWLLDSSLETTSWRTLDPQPPMYFFTPQNTDLLAEYQQGWKVTDVFPVNSVGIVTARDRLTIHLSTDDVWKTVKDFASISAEEAREKYRLGSDARDWKVQLAQEDLRGSGPAEDRIEPILYRPFDKRFTYYTGRTRGFICMPMRDVMQHTLPGNNLGLIVPRRVELVGPWMHCLASNVIIDHVVVSLKTIDSLLQLYLFPVAEKVTAKQSSWLNTSPWPPDAHGRVPNLAPAFVAEVEARLGMKFLTSAGRAHARRPGGMGATAAGQYLHPRRHLRLHLRHLPCAGVSQPLRRVPQDGLPARPDHIGSGALWQLAALGRELVALHLLDVDAAPALLKPITRYPVGGDGPLEKGHPRYDEAQRRVYISAGQRQDRQTGPIL